MRAILAGKRGCQHLRRQSHARRVARAGAAAASTGFNCGEGVKRTVMSRGVRARVAGCIAHALLWAAGSVSAAEPQAQAPEQGDWKVAVGPGLYIFPAYPGSSRLKLFPLPAQDISWRDRIFSQGPDVLGINMLQGENYHV